jgi:hypothetical protein
MRMVFLASVGLTLSVIYTCAAFPFVQTLPPTAVETNGATLNGFVDPQGVSFTTVWFEFGPTTAYGSTTPEQLALGPWQFSYALTGLTNGMTYHYRAVAFNSQGMGFGFDQSFTAGPAFAAIAWYRLGENDPGAADGTPVPATTVNLLGTNHLRQYGGPIYTAAVSTGANNRLGSSLAVQFNGTSQYVSNALVSSAIDNFGIEAWVKPSNVNAGVRIIACNGNTAANGWGLFQNGTGYSAVLGGVTTFGAGTAVAGAWTHIALVRHIGTSTLYVNGTAAGSSGALPLPPAGGFTLATGAQQPNTELFNGAIDEVRVFTFQPGQFTTNQLLFHLQRAATLAASDVGVTNATLNGTVSAAGLPTRGWFEWGFTTNYGNGTVLRAIGSGGSDLVLSEPLSGLFGGTHHFRVVASNGLGVATGADATLATPLFLWYTNVSGSRYISGAWGDYDNDGRLDVTFRTRSISHWELWRNTGAGFTAVGLSIANNAPGDSIEWGDFDNDGLLDIMFGEANPWILRNAGTNNRFTAYLNGVDPSVVGAPTAARDLDNDGRVDILCWRTIAGGSAAHVYRNTGTGFAEWRSFLGRADQGLDADDYDNDGRVDLLMQEGSGPVVWRNTEMGFSNINAIVSSPRLGPVAWTDYDNDGRPDIFFAGWTNSGVPPVTLVCELWRNTGSGFSKVNPGIPGRYPWFIEWADFDNDGRSDLLFRGDTNSVLTAPVEIWRNTPNGFAPVYTGIPTTNITSAAAGDFDNDGRLDLLFVSEYGDFFEIWRNNCRVTNTPPTPPSGLTYGAISNAAGQFIRLGWNAGTDVETLNATLTYNARLGTNSGGIAFASPMSLNDGRRQIPRRGNRSRARQWLINMTNLVVNHPYYFSVQTVDGAFAGSRFSPEITFRLQQLPQPSPLVTSLAITNLVYGDFNGDGHIDANELNTLLGPYYEMSPWLQITNIAGLAETNVTFALSNSAAGAFSVEYSTNLTNWSFLGPAVPRYLFVDTNAPVQPQRYYRLRWP